jgi:hypothetical protein
VPAGFRDAPTVDDDDSIGMLDGAETVSDHQHGPPLRQVR